MRIDIITIFPEYLQPLHLSLVGRARQRGIIDLRVHDLRDWAQDRHRSVDDSPYGGGPGMVMRPDVWGEALDAVRGHDPEIPLLIIPTPTGERLSQSRVAALRARPWLILACGRYEGIDERVADYYAAAPGWEVNRLSLGDYVVSGGEVAALVIVEAVTRLVPGVLGNESSALEDSFGPTGDGSLEAPVFTRPEVWRGRHVPEALRSGDHGRIAQWRQAEGHRRRPGGPNLSP